MHYRIFNLIIESEQPLPELPTCTATSADLRIQWLPAQAEQPEIDQWQHHWVEDDCTQLSIANAASGWLFRFPEESDFAVNAAATTLTITACSGVAASTLRHQLLDQVLPRLMSQRGCVSLHASAVQSAAGTLLFVGESGAGKSSIAAYLDQRGWPLLCDDSVILLRKGSVVSAVPAYSGARLYADSPVAAVVTAAPTQPPLPGSGKHRYPLGADEGGKPQPVAHIMLLPEPTCRQPGEPLLTPVAGAEAAVALLAASFQFDVSDQTHMQRYFKALGDILASGVRVSRLAYRHDAQCLQELEASLRQLSAQTEAGSVTP